MRALALVGMVLLAWGCQGKPATEETETAKPVTNQFADWPEDNLPRPTMTGGVERVSEKLENDPEKERYPAFHVVPDWAEPDGPIGYRLPKGAKLTYHYLPWDPDLKKTDLEFLARLQKGEKIAGKERVYARPWRGWYGESGGKDERNRPYRLRIYQLFRDDERLEIHLEWPVDNRAAFDEGELVMRYLVYSVQRLGKD